METLTEEAECPMDHPLAAKFRQLVISGKWDEVGVCIPCIVTRLL